LTAPSAADPGYRRVATLRTPEDFRAHLDEIRVRVGFDAELASGASSPLGRPIDVDGVRVGNRFCILPMEGWDGTREGQPSELTERRWRHFGISGAKLIWGGEAAPRRRRAWPGCASISSGRTASVSVPRPIPTSTSACSSPIPAASRGPA